MSDLTRSLWRDVPVLMSRKLVALSAMVTSCAALSLLSGGIYVGCSKTSRPAHLPPATSSADESPVILAQADPATPSTAGEPTTQLPQAEALPIQPAPVTAMAIPVHLQGSSVSETLELNDADVLAAQALDTANSAQLRYTALRRLEQVDPARAGEVAWTLAGDASSIVATNALAVLVRQGDPRISSLDPRSQRIAAALASQG